MKIKSQDLHELPQNAIDQLEDTRILLNFGKYQTQVLSAIPTYTGRQGEFVMVFGGGTGVFYWCVSDMGNTWGRVF